jgi:hypothetical protein
VVSILAHWDAEDVATAMKRLLDAEGERTTLEMGGNATHFTFNPAYTSRVVAVWSAQSASDASMVLACEEAGRHSALVELRVGPSYPSVTTRKALPIDFTGWKGQRSGEWGRLRDRLRHVDREDAVRQEVKLGASLLGVLSIVILVPVGLDRVLSASDTGAAPSTGLVANIAPLDMQPTGDIGELSENIGGPIVAPIVLEDETIRARMFRARPLTMRPAPGIASLAPAPQLVDIEIQRERGIVGRILAAASDLPLISDAQTQSN